MASKLRRAPLFPYNEASVFLTTPGIPPQTSTKVMVRMTRPDRTECLGPARYIICGTFSGITYVLASQPIKIMQQAVKSLPKAKQRRAYHNMHLLLATMLQGIQKTVDQQGVKGLFQGMGTRFLLTVPPFASSFTGYGIGLHLFGADHHPGGKLTYEQIFFAGCFSPVVSTLIVTPCERIKDIVTKTRYRSKRYYTGGVDCTVHWFKQVTLYKLFRNSWLTFLRDVPSKGVFFLSYEVFMDLMRTTTNTDTGMVKTVIAGGLSGMLHKLVVMPFDTVKHVLHMDTTRKYKYKPSQILADLYRVKGPRALFHGMGGVLMIGIPGTAGCFLGFELCRMFLEYLWPLESPPPLE